jgi:hypothetical protein
MWFVDVNLDSPTVPTAHIAPTAVMMNAATTRNTNVDVHAGPCRWAMRWALRWVMRRVVMMMMSITINDDSRSPLRSRRIDYRCVGLLWGWLNCWLLIASDQSDQTQSGDDSKYGFHSTSLMNVYMPKNERLEKSCVVMKSQDVV